MDTFGRTEKQAEIFLTDEPVEKADIIIRSDAKAFIERHPHFTLNDSEYMSTGSSFYSQLLYYDGVMIHSSAVVVDGRAYIFSAPSGTGKSTHTKLWLKKFGPDRAYILNDDKPALRIIDGKAYAYGTPWNGKSSESVNAKVPLAGICVLRQGAVNKIERHSGSKALFDLLNQTMRPSSQMWRDKLINSLSQLVATVPIWRLECNMEMEAAEVSYNAMSK